MRATYMLISLLVFGSLLGQQRQPFRYLPDSISLVLQPATEKLASDLAIIRSSSLKDKAEIIKEFNKRFEDFRKEMAEGYFFFEPYAKTYVENILKTILEGNPELDLPEVRIWIHRDEVPNAYCQGDGNIVLYADLLRKLENESQLAFIICHELAHYMEDHVNKALKEYVRITHSDSLKKVLKTISKTEYGKTQQAMNLLKDLVYDRRKHTRNHESEADSLALRYLYNTPYDLREAATVLTLLDSIDKEKFRPVLSLREKFDAEEFPFREAWIKPSGSSLAGFGMVDDEKKLLDQDSLKTHPDCRKRADAILRQVENMGEDGKQRNVFAQPEQTFRRLVKDLDIEMFYSSLHRRNFGRALYHGWILPGQYPEEYDIYIGLSQVLDSLITVKIEMRQGKHVSLNRKGFSDDYNQVLLFISNTRADDLRQIKFHFEKKHIDNLAGSEEILYRIYDTCLQKGDTDFADSVRSIYLSRYPEGKFLTNFR